MKKLILHIGMHRSGTTSIQNYLNDNFGHLEGLGVRVFKPKIFDSVNSSEYFIFESKARSDRFDEFKQFLRAPCELGVVSGEELSRLDADTISEINSLIAELEIPTKVIAYVRQPNDYVDSAASKMIDSSGYNLYTLISCDGLIPRYDCLVDWFDIFQNNLEIVPYDSKSTLTTFVEYLKIGTQGKQAYRANPSKCMEHIILKAALNDDRYKASKDMLDIISKYSTGKKFIAPREVVESIGSATARNIQLFNSKVINMLDPLIANSRPRISDYSKPEVLVSCLSFVFEQLASATTATLINGAYCFKNLAEDSSDDFDPFGYLIKNFDLCFSEVDPRDHFEKHGRNEGREYFHTAAKEMVLGLLKSNKSEGA